jgi:hypothetical protein
MNQQNVLPHLDLQAFFVPATPAAAQDIPMPLTV